MFEIIFPNLCFSFRISLSFSSIVSLDFSLSKPFSEFQIAFWKCKLKNKTNVNKMKTKFENTHGDFVEIMHHMNDSKKPHDDDKHVAD